MELDITRWAGDPDPPRPDSLVIDCDRCRVRGPACADCVVTCLLGEPAEPVQLDGDEVHALGALAGLGMVPPLRLVTAVTSVHPDLDDEPGPA